MVEQQAPGRRGAQALAVGGDEAGGDQVRDLRMVGRQVQRGDLGEA